MTDTVGELSELFVSGRLLSCSLEDSLHVRAVGLREGLGNLVFGADAHLDENFAEELLVVGALLLLERALELLGLEKPFVQQELTERFSLKRGDHGWASD